MLKVERETHIFPLQLAEDGRVRREAQASAVKIRIGPILFILGVIRKVETY